MKSDRLLSVLLLLQAKGRATERELAEQLEVSQRTIHRDLEALSAAKVPVLALRGAQGGWQIEPGWRTQVPGLDENELRALIMAQPRMLGDPGLRTAAESALNKLMASLPGALREQATVLRERVHVDPDGWWETGEDLSALPPIQDAVAASRKLAFDYVKANGEASSRTVDPLGLVVKGLNWYLVARTPKGMRTFRVSRMRTTTVLATKFRRPMRFKLDVHWKRATAELQEKRIKVPAVLCVSMRGLQRLTELGFVSEKIEDESRLEESWVKIRIAFDDEARARFIVLGMGCDAVLLEPTALRQSIEVEVAATSALYDAATSD